MYRQQKLRNHIALTLKMTEATGYVKAIQTEQLDGLGKLSNFINEFEDIILNILNNIEKERTNIKNYYKKTFTKNKEYQEKISILHKESFTSSIETIAFLNAQNSQIGIGNLLTDLGITENTNEQDEILKLYDDIKDKSKDIRKNIKRYYFTLLSKKKTNNTDNTNNINNLPIDFKNPNQITIFIVIICIVILLGFGVYGILSSDN